MTLLRHRANGHRPSLKPLLEPAGENTVTPQALADLIAKSVCKEIKSAREEICAAAIPALSQAANVILPQLAQAASARGESLVTAAETAFVATAKPSGRRRRTTSPSSTPSSTTGGGSSRKSSTTSTHRRRVSANHSRPLRTKASSP
jgi:hypothetical protein